MALDLHAGHPALSRPGRAWQQEVEGVCWRGWHWPGSGPRCLALHGWLDNAGSFARLSAHLPDWDLLAVDLPGHGQSDFLPPGASYHFADTLAGVCGLVRGQSGPPLHLLGHSLGGGLATMAAGVLGDQLASVIALDALGPLVTAPDDAPDQFRRALEALPDPRRRLYASRAEAVARLGRNGHSPEAAEALALRGLEEREEGWSFRFDPRLKLPSRQRWTEPQVQAFLRRVSCPALIVSFAEGMMPRFAPFEERLGCLDPARLNHQVVGGGHHAHLEFPAQVAEVTLSFQRGLLRPE